MKKHIKTTAVFFLLGLVSSVAVSDRAVAANDILYGVSLCALTPAMQVQAVAIQPYTIAIDPGHGGVDTGAQHLVDEIDVINRTAQYLYDMLDRDEDFMPVFTREYDTDPESSRRCRTARNAGASLLISIHANCDSAKSTHGFECFPVPPGRQTHQDSLRFAGIVTRLMAENGHSLRGSRVKDGIKYAYYQGKNKIIVESSDTKVRSRKSFGILEKSPCPALLVEQCFITNYADVQNWRTDAGCRKAAAIYYNAIKEYFAEQN